MSFSWATHSKVQKPLKKSKVDTFVHSFKHYFLIQKAQKERMRDEKKNRKFPFPGAECINKHSTIEEHVEAQQGVICHILSLVNFSLILILPCQGIFLLPTTKSNIIPKSFLKVLTPASVGVCANVKLKWHVFTTFPRINYGYTP